MLYDATGVALFGICKIPGCTGCTYRTFDSVAYWVFFVDITICTVVAPLILEWAEITLVLSQVEFGIGNHRW